MSPRDELSRLLEDLDPRRTILVFGAGAARSSGAPLSVELCRQLEADLARGEHISDELSELAGILEYRTSRRQLVEAVIRQLEPLQPDGALVAVAPYRWPSIYTTNYDLLVERAFERAQVPLSVVRSHYDWEEAHRAGVTTLYKLHGCITQDRCMGHLASMIITAQDYTSFESYRTLLFDRLKIELAGSTCCIIGHSLKDPDIRRLVDEALRLQQHAAAPGRICLVVHEYDPERAALWRARGIHAVVHGDINRFVYELASTGRVSAATAVTTGSPTVELPHRLAACTINVACDTAAANARRLFYGGAATYGDIKSGYTFERADEVDLLHATGLCTVITGVAGTGKTTLARRLLLEHIEANNWIAYEHRTEFPLEPDLWISFEEQLSKAGLKAALLVDNCPPFQRQVNALVRGLPPESALHVIVTGETSAWKVRQKDHRLFRDAKSICLSRLTNSEVRGLCDLVIRAPGLHSLLDPEFIRESRQNQVRILERKCSADMFVCLKALFSAETLDEIILREYAALEPPFQDIYRATAALEAAGGVPHRQMVLRITRFPAGMISAALDVLEGLVDEQPENTSLGIYLWRTRHEVIADLISRYKYPEPPELKALLEEVIVTSNPSFFEEARTLRELCNASRGIRALPDPKDRIALYQRITEVVPTDRVARHRLIAELIDSDRFGEAEAELRSTVQSLGLDPPLQRYRVRMHVLRSQRPGLLEEDRKSILRAALTEAEAGINRFPDNKYMYFAAADVAEEWYRLTDERGLLEWAKLKLRRAEQDLLDPEIGERLSYFARL